MSTTSSESYDQSIPQQPDPGGQQLPVTPLNRLTTIQDSYPQETATSSYYIATAAEPLFETTSRVLGPGGRNILDSPEPEERPQIPPETLYSNQSYYFHHAYTGGGSSSSAAQSESKDLGNRQQIDKFEEGHAPQGLFQAIPHSSHGQFEVVGGFITNPDISAQSPTHQSSVGAPSPSRRKSPSTSSFVCEWEGCGKEFKTQWHLISHNNSHTNIKPFACTLCPLSFARKHDLSRHERSVHAVKAGAPVFACGICGKGFGRVDSLKRHVKICKG